MAAEKSTRQGLGIEHPEIPMLGTTQGRKAWTEPKKELGKQRECWRGHGGGYEDGGRDDDFYF